METPPTLCALYTRVSSRTQLDNDYGSLQTQRERLEAYCKSQPNYEVRRVYEDGAFSGENLERPALKEMLLDIQAGKITCVLAYKIDRLTRSVKDFHRLMELFDKHGVKFVSITQHLDTGSPMGRLMRNILLDFAQFEREMTADRTRDKMQQRAEKGLWSGGRLPYGYANENKRLVPHPEESTRLRFMFDYFNKHPSLSQLQDELRRRAWHDRKGQPWLKSVLNHILRNPLYAGKIRFNGKVFDGQHPALIGAHLLHKTQALKRDGGHPSTKIARHFLLKSILRCGCCGSMMTPHYSQKRLRDGSVHRTSYYRCTRTLHLDKRACSLKQLNADKIEQQVLDRVRFLTENANFVRMSVEKVNAELRTSIGPQAKELATLKARASELEREIARFMQAFGKGTLPLARLESEVQRREQDLKALKGQIEDLQRQVESRAVADYNADALLKGLNDFNHLYPKLHPDEQTQALKNLLSTVHALPEGPVMDVYQHPVFDKGSQNHSERLPE